MLAKHPNDRDALMALATLQHDAGRLDAARDYARPLAALEPNYPEIPAFLQRQ